MKTEFHSAAERGHADHGWLNTYHNFSFASYFNPVRERFGCLRVLNDDTVAGGTGFDIHPHNNMEIISIPTRGALEHSDSMGNMQVIESGEVQVMSAGTGLFHSEYNASSSDPVCFFQIWIFPRAKGATPRYEQRRIPNPLPLNEAVTLVTPDNRQEPEALWIGQDAYLSMVRIEKGKRMSYPVRIPGNGVFAFCIEGEAEIAGIRTGQRDAAGISETNAFEYEALSDSQLLFIEVPME
jgi:quercetin 2,3-dioxygenase